MATQERRQQERAHRKQEILRAARSVFAQHGFRRATVDEIARRAEIAKGTVYLYFESKEAILAELVLLALAELSARLEDASDGGRGARPEAALRAMAEAYLRFAGSDPDYYRLLTAFESGDFEAGVSPSRRPLVIEGSNRALDLVTRAIADGMALGTFLPGNPRQAAGVLWAALNGALALVAHPIRRELVAADAASLYHATLELCLKGLKCPTFTERSAP